MNSALLKRIFLNVLNWTSFAVLVPAAVLVIASLVPIPGGFKVYTVLTGSMEPAVPTGALILTRTGMPADKISTGDIATFKSPRSDDVLITHRIAEVIGEGEGLRFITRGDANGAVDPWEVRAGNIEGIYRQHVPYVGFALEFAKTPMGLLLLVILPTVLIAASELRQIVRVLVERQLNQIAAAYGYDNFTSLLQNVSQKAKRPARRVAQVLSRQARVTPAFRPAVRNEGPTVMSRRLDSVWLKPTVRKVEPLIVIAPSRHHWLAGGALLVLLLLVGTVMALLVSNTVVLGSNTVITAARPLAVIPEECSHIEFDGEPLVGEDKSEVLEGTEGNDLIIGNGGSDKLEGLGGDDCLVGGADSDSLRGGDGNDILLGGESTDTLRGEAGDDKLYGGEGTDSLRGGIGDDEMYGGGGKDSIDGEDGDDSMYGENDDDSIKGGSGDDYLTGGDGVDVARGEDGVDNCEAEVVKTCEAVLDIE